MKGEQEFRKLIKGSILVSPIVASIPVMIRYLESGMPGIYEWYLLSVIISALAMVSTTIGDAATTIYAFNRHGDKIVEENPYLPEQPTARDLLSPYSLIHDTLTLGAGIIVPVLGFYASKRRIDAIYNNFQVIKQMEKK